MGRVYERKRILAFTVKFTPPGEDHGSNADVNGNGKVRGGQLIRQMGTVEDRTFEIEFLDPDRRASVCLHLWLIS